MSRSSTPSAVRTLHGTIVRESEKAVLFNIVSVSGSKVRTQAAQWFPLSQVSKMMKTEKRGEDWIIVSEWIIEQKKLNLTPEEILDGNVSEPSETEQDDTGEPEDIEDTYDRMNKGM